MVFKCFYRSLLCLLLLCLSYGLHAEIVLSDSQAAELEQTLDELEIVIQEQQTTIDDLRMQNELLLTQSQNKQNLLTEQEKKINELNDSLDELEKSSVKQNALMITISVMVGIIIGVLI